MKCWLSTVLLILAATATGAWGKIQAQEKGLTLRVTSTENRASATLPLCVPLSLPKEWAHFNEVAVDISTGKDPVKTAGQLTAPGIATEAIAPAAKDLVRRDLHLLLPALPAGTSWTLNVHFQKSEPQVRRFIWNSIGNDHEIASWTGSGIITPMLMYVHFPYDPSSKEARHQSYKVFHHLYDPAGKRLVTNAGFASKDNLDPKKLLYPHHRGIMYGFNKCSYGPDLKKKADTWHCTGDSHVAHEKMELMEAGPVLARQRALVGWFGEKDERFAQEERELTVYRVPGGTLVDFASRLRSTGGKVRLDGDPQHAGFQFRAHNDVAEKTKKQTYFLHPDGKGEMGKERNWPQDKSMMNLPWYAMSFVLDEKRYTVCYLNHPQNPQGTRFSERDYGRIGGYFQRDVTVQEPLVVRYRLWLQPGEMTGAEALALRTAFADPPAAALKERATQDTRP